MLRKAAAQKRISGRQAPQNAVTEVRPNIGTHPEFGEAMEDAKEAGVEIWFLTCHVEPDKLEITGRT